MLTPKKHNAFTLIELLVSISIIGILAAIIVPAAGTVRNSARATRCMSNLRSLQMANQGYALDWGGIYAPSVQAVPAGGSWDWNTNWFKNGDFLQLIDGSAQYPAGMLCPMSKKSPTASAVSTSYGMNNQAFVPFVDFLSPPPGGMRCLSVAQVRSPETVFVFSDGLSDTLMQSGWGSYIDANQEGQYTPGAPAYRHGKYAQAVMYDGHVQKIARNQLSVLLPHWSW